MISKDEIKKIIPYQEPFLFVDQVEEMGDSNVSGFYQTSADDYYFKGHFVDFKIMPGVLVVEALAQLSTILLRKKIGDNHRECHFLAYDVKSCQFLKPIFPGDKIILKAEVLGVYPIPDSKTPTPETGEGVKTKIARVRARALVENELKAETRFSVVIINKPRLEIMRNQSLENQSRKK